jgi:hypothetical protein
MCRRKDEKEDGCSPIHTVIIDVGTLLMKGDLS